MKSTYKLALLPKDVFIHLVRTIINRIHDSSISSIHSVKKQGKNQICGKNKKEFVPSELRRKESSFLDIFVISWDSFRPGLKHISLKKKLYFIPVKILLQTFIFFPFQDCILAIPLWRNSALNLALLKNSSYATQSYSFDLWLYI